MPVMYLDRCRCREATRHLLRKVLRNGHQQLKYRGGSGTTHQNQEQKLNRSTQCLEAIEDADPFSIDPPGIEKLSGMR